MAGFIEKVARDL